MRSFHVENHRAHRIGWLRAAVLGANDGIVSTSSLMVGVATASASHTSAVLTAADRRDQGDVALWVIR